MAARLFLIVTLVMFLATGEGLTSVRSSHGFVSFSVERSGSDHFAWDPDPAAGLAGQRQWGRPNVVERIRATLAEFRSKHPTAPRIGVGDLSRPDGRYLKFAPNRVGHLSHRRGVDVDLYYPRADGAERAPDRELNRRLGRYVCPGIDHELARALVKTFADQPGIELIFVGPDTGIPVGGKVRLWPEHEDHFHVRFH